jgi:RNA polymerase sigma-70 factor (ECF subfamily)
MTETPFADLLARVRAGDPAAAEELVRRYEPMVRLEVRMGLRDPRLKRLFDSVDVCQSVLASFFVRAAAGQYELERPENLAALLAAMARNKLAAQARRHGRRVRDVRRQADGPVVEAAVPAADPAPSRVAEYRVLLARFRDRLSADERRLADLRALGRSWAEIAGEVGGDPRTLGKRFERAVDRVARELGLEV